MRDIKFRFAFAYEKSKRFVAFRHMTLDELLDSNFAYEKMNEDIFGGFGYEEDIVTLEVIGKDECTWLKDKNDIEIYEGDIFKEGGSLGLVIFDKGRYMVKWIIDKDSFSNDLCNHCENSLIVGNIYENKELLNA